jgi:DNA polymerase-1
LRLVADIETDGFVEHLTKIHCIAVMNADDTSQKWVYGPDKIEIGVQHLASASELILHNGIAFDIPAIQKIFPDFNANNELKVTDTLVLSRLIRPDLRNEDFATNLPKKLHGSHSLKAWGQRLGLLKGDFGETADWSVWTQEMSDYCEIDVAVCHKLWKALAPHEWPNQAIEFEHQLAELCYRIGRAGWTFDMDKAAKLYGDLSQERSELEKELHQLFPAWTVEEEFIPKVNNKARGYQKGVPFIKQQTMEFNPNSRKHIEFCLRNKYKWKPKVFTPSGSAKIDETTLSTMPFPEAQKLAHSFTISKRLAMLAEGNAAWMKLVGKDGKLRHTINSLGSISGRCSSFAPNLQQVPSVGSEYGEQCRELFTVPEGRLLCGVDLSGIELRCLAHYLQDGGAYAKEILEGDIHSANAKAMGVSRSQSKTAVYCMIYGGSDKRLGEAVNGSAADGKAIRQKFYQSNPAFEQLLKAIAEVVRQRGHLTGLDGRRLYARSDHGQLNILLQSAAALIAKQFVLNIDKAIKQENLDAEIVAFVHDEAQISTTNQEGVANNVGNIAIRCAKEAGEHFRFKIPIGAEFRIGLNWAATH